MLPRFHASDGAIDAIQIDHDIGDGAPDIDGLRLQPRRVLERRQRFLELLLLTQHAAEREQILRLCLLRDRASRPLRGEIEVLRVDGDQAHQMQRVGVRGIGGQGLLGAHLRIEHSSRAQMRKARFIKHGGIGLGCFVGTCESLAGSPAFARVHGPRLFDARTAESLDDSVTWGKQAPCARRCRQRDRSAYSRARSVPDSPPG